MIKIKKGCLIAMGTVKCDILLEEKGSHIALGSVEFTANDEPILKMNYPQRISRVKEIIEFTELIKREILAIRIGF